LRHDRKGAEAKVQIPLNRQALAHNLRQLILAEAHARDALLEFRLRRKEADEFVQSGADFRVSRGDRRQLLRFLQDQALTDDDVEGAIQIL
jgi:hypothetical protein